MSSLSEQGVCCSHGISRLKAHIYCFIYGFIYGKSKLIQEFCFQLNPYSDRRRKQSVLLKRFLFTRYGKFHPKAVLLKKNVSKVEKIFFSSLVSSRNLLKRPEFYTHNHPIIRD